MVAAELAQYEDGRVHLRYRLDAEAVVGVAHRDDAPVGQANADAEQVGIHVGQVGNVMGVLAAGEVLACGIGIFDGGLHLVVGERVGRGQYRPPKVMPAIVSKVLLNSSNVMC